MQNRILNWSRSHQKASLCNGIYSVAKECKLLSFRWFLWPTRDKKRVNNQKYIIVVALRAWSFLLFRTKLHWNFCLIFFLIFWPKQLKSTNKIPSVQLFQLFYSEFFDDREILQESVGDLDFSFNIKYRIADRNFKNHLLSRSMDPLDIVSSKNMNNLSSFVIANFYIPSANLP